MGTFEHILLPTDGSATAGVAVQAGLQLAKDIGARVTALYVVPQSMVYTFTPEMIGLTSQQYEKDSSEFAQKVLADVERLASQQGVPCDTVQTVSDQPFEAIIDTARDRRCDLIAMASHGRKGVQALLLGSETHKVLTHSAIPVLVLR